MTQAVTVILKPGYAPIEQYADDATMQQGPWTDVYALSAVLHLAITGKAPPASVTRMINDPMRPLRETVPGYSEEFLAAIERGLSVRPEQRPQSIAEFRTLLGVSTLAPGAGSWTMNPTTVGGGRPGPVTSMQPPTSIPQTRSGPVSAVPSPVTTGSVQRNSVSMFGGLGGTPAAPPAATECRRGSDRRLRRSSRCPSPKCCAVAHAGACRAEAGDSERRACRAGSRIVTVGIGVGIYFAISSSKPSPIPTTPINRKGGNQGRRISGRSARSSASRHHTGPDPQGGNSTAGGRPCHAAAGSAGAGGRTRPRGYGMGECADSRNT